MAEVYVGDHSINLNMVQEGQAVVYKQYLKGCASTKDQFIKAETTAKQQKLGFWNQAKPLMPWDFRQGKGTTTQPVVTQPQQQQQCDPSYPDFCLPPSSPDLDCKDIAYRRFRVNQPDPHKFDRDKDGIGCES